MLLAITISLLTSAGSTAASDELTLPPWPSGLTDAIVTEDGMLLPPALADAVHYRLEACEALPARCAARLDALRYSLGAECDSRVRLAKIDSAQPAERLPAWLVAGVAGVVAGALAGGAVTLWLVR